MNLYTPDITDNYESIQCECGRWEPCRHCKVDVGSENDYAKGKIIAIGDIHGELYQLQELFNKIPINKGDRIIFLGDYIDRGKHSKQVIDFIIDLKTRHDVVCLEGNHEMMAYETSIQRGMGNQTMWYSNGGRECLESYGKELRPLERMFEQHGNFFKELKTCHEEQDYIFVHGYLDADKDCKDQNRFSCLWNRYNDILPHKSGKTVVCGHTPQRGGVDNRGYKVCIDTGSYLRDGYITAMVIDGVRTGFVSSR